MVCGCHVEKGACFNYVDIMEVEDRRACVRKGRAVVIIKAGTRPLCAGESGRGWAMKSNVHASHILLVIYNKYVYSIITKDII